MLNNHNKYLLYFNCHCNLNYGSQTKFQPNIYMNIIGILECEKIDWKLFASFGNKSVTISEFAQMNNSEDSSLYGFFMVFSLFSKSE